MEADYLKMHHREERASTSTVSAIHIPSYLHSHIPYHANEYIWTLLEQETSNALNISFSMFQRHRKCFKENNS